MAIPAAARADLDGVARLDVGRIVGKKDLICSEQVKSFFTASHKDNQLFKSF